MLRVTHSADDELIKILLDGADEFVEGSCGIGLSEATQEDHLNGGGRFLWPCRLPVASLTSIYDEKDEAAIATTEYRLHNRTRILYDGEYWPEGEQRYHVTYLGGYGDTVLVPAGLKTLVAQLVYRAYFNRGSLGAESVAGWSMDWESLLESDLMGKLSRYRLGGAVL